MKGSLRTVNIGTTCARSSVVVESYWRLRADRCVLWSTDKLGQGSNDVERALSVCDAHDAVEEVDRAVLAAMVPAAKDGMSIMSQRRQAAFELTFGYQARCADPD